MGEFSQKIAKFSNFLALATPKVPLFCAFGAEKWSFRPKRAPSLMKYLVTSINKLA